MKLEISRLALLAALAASGAAGGFGSGAARAQGGAEEKATELLGTITLTASLEAVDVSRTGASVTVVTEDEIRASGVLSLPRYLTQLPGITQTSNGGIGSLSTLRVRGLPGYYLGVRMDGIDLTDPSNTQVAFDFGAAVTGSLSRIEVLRGSQSALYGSEAVAGVIDLTSWRPETEGVSGQAGLEGGSNGSWTGTASVGAKSERGEIAFSFGRSITDGISASALGTDDDGFQASTANLYAAYEVAPGLTLGASGIYSKSFAEFDEQTYDADNTTDKTQRGGRLFAQFVQGAVSHELSVSRMTMDRSYIQYGNPSYYDGDRDRIGYSGNWSASEVLSLNWGLERTKESFNIASHYNDWVTGAPVVDVTAGEVRTDSLQGEVLWSPNADLDLSLALRHDDHELFGGQTSGRAALAWRPDEDWIIRAVASQGYRSPSPYELYSLNGSSDFGPEKSRSLELGAEYLLPGGSVQATLFDIRIDDQIIFDPVPFMYRQISGESRSRGIELVARYDISPEWSVFGNYTYADAEVDEAGQIRRMARAPRHDLTLGVEGQIADRLTALFTLNHVAGFLDEYTAYPPFPADPYLVQVGMKDYTLANMTLTYDVNDDTSAYLRVENLFDEDYQTAFNYGQPGRQVFVGLRTRF